MMPQLFACGSNASGQLAIHSTEDVHTFTPTQFHPSLAELLPGCRILDVVSASTHALLLMRTPGTSADDNSGGRNMLLGAGTNTQGQLGPKCALWEGSRAETRWKTVDLLGPTGRSHDDWQAVKIAVTWTTTFVVYRQIGSRNGAAAVPSAPDSNDGERAEEIILSCGSNDFGELGRSSTPSTGHIAVSTASDNPTEVNVGLRTGEKVDLIKGGQRHVLVVVSGVDGRQRVMGWGASRKGELHHSAPPRDEAGTAPLSSKGKGKRKQSDVKPYLPPTLISLPVPPGQRIVDISLGANHSLALISDGSVLAWGSDTKGQIMGMQHVQHAIGISTPWGGSYIMVDQASQEGGRAILSQGASSHSQLLRLVDAELRPAAIQLPKDLDIRAMAAGSEHLIVHAVNPDTIMDEVWVGGWNEHGNLGLGDTVDRARLTKVDLGSAISGVKAEDRINVKGIWGGCAASWLWLET